LSVADKQIDLLIAECSLEFESNEKSPVDNRKSASRNRLAGRYRRRE